MSHPYRTAAGQPPAQRWGASLWVRLATFFERRRRLARRNEVADCWEGMIMQSRNDYRNPAPIRCHCGHHVKDADGRWPYVRATSASDRIKPDAMPPHEPGRLEDRR